MSLAPHTVAAHARDLRLLSVYGDLESWIEHAQDNAKPNTPEGAIAAAVFCELVDLKGRLDPMVERLAAKAAASEAQVEAEIAAYELVVA